MKITVYFSACFVFTTSAFKLKLVEQFDSDGWALAECIEQSKWNLNKIVMISDEVDQTPYATKIIKALSYPVTIVSTDDEFSVSEVTFILFSIQRFFYYNLFKRVRIEDKAKVLIMWKWPIRVFKHFSFEEARSNLEKILYVMWLHQIYDVYVLVEDENSDVDIYTYSPYGENHCNDVGPPLHIDTWNSTTKRYMTNMFRIDNSKQDTRRQLMKNLHGCPVNVLVKNRPPESVALMTPDNRLVLKGSGGSILSALMRRYNFTVKIKLVEDNFGKNDRDENDFAMSSYSAESLIEDLKTGKYDFAFGVFSYLGYFSQDIDFSQYYLNEHFAFYVPCGTKKEILYIWEDFYLEFPTNLWFCMGFILFFAALVLKIIAIILPRENPVYLSFWRNIFALWALHIENNIKDKTVTLTMRVVLTALMFYCTIMSVAYRASLKSLLLAPWDVNSIETWQELEQSGFSIIGIPEMYDIFDKISTRYEILRSLKKRFRVKTSSEFEEIVDAIMNKRDAAYFGPESVIAYYNTLENEKNTTKRQSICQVNKVVATSPASPFLMRKGSMFLDIINQVTNDMVQTGQMEQLAFTSAVKQVSRHNLKDNERPMSLEDLQGVFYILSIGLTLAITIFIFENLYSRIEWRRLAAQIWDFIN